MLIFVHPPAFVRIFQDPDPAGGNALDISFLLKPPGGPSPTGGDTETWHQETPMLCASISGRVAGTRMGGFGDVFWLMP